ncbi:MAG: patatin-like phospholipase family protein [Rickettsiaceae bacterium]|nr:patatin-like phospholipase family protein [Rickettsiaceae bacterium]
MKKIYFIIPTLLLLLSSCQGRLMDQRLKAIDSDVKAKGKSINVALVLGGGGARAMSELGVIEVLHQNNIPIDLIVGTSAGSIMGALYADGMDTEKIKKIGLGVKKEDLIKVSLKDALDGTRSLKGGFDGRAAEKFAEQNLSVKEFKDLKIPFIAVATDLKSGKTIGLKKGNIAPAIRASCSIPALFSPVEMDGMILVDGGVSAPVAVYVAKEYNPKVIIAVDVSTPLSEAKVKNMFDVAHRSAYISYDTLCKLNGMAADVLIKPTLKDIGIFDEGKNEQAYLAGREATIKLLPKIKAILKEKISK